MSIHVFSSQKYCTFWARINGESHRASARVGVRSHILCLQKSAENTILTAFNGHIYARTVTKLAVCAHSITVNVTLSQFHFGSIGAKVA